MLRSFSEKWMTNAEYSTVDEARARVGSPGGSTEYRLTEKWTSSAKSVFHFDVQGSVAKSTHAGLPWINEMYGNKEITERTHFWPLMGSMSSQEKMWWLKSSHLLLGGGMKRKDVLVTNMMLL